MQKKDFRIKSVSGGPSRHNLGTLGFLLAVSMCVQGYVGGIPCLNLIVLVVKHPTGQVDYKTLHTEVIQLLNSFNDLNPSCLYLSKVHTRMVSLIRTNLVTASLRNCDRLIEETQFNENQITDLFLKGQGRWKTFSAPLSAYIRTCAVQPSSTVNL